MNTEEILEKIKFIGVELKQNPYNLVNLIHLANFRDIFAEQIRSHDLFSPTINTGITEIYEILLANNCNYLHYKINVSTRFKILLNQKKELDAANFDNEFLTQAPLFFSPHQLFQNNKSKILKKFSNKFQKIYNKFIFSPPLYFSGQKEVDLYKDYFRRVLLELFEVAQDSDTNFFINTLLDFFNISTIIPLYFANDSLREIMQLRARLIEFLIPKLTGINDLDYPFDKRKTKNEKIKIGILSAHFKSQTETYATLPVYEYLDKSKYEVILISQLQFTDTAIETKCRLNATSIHQLTQDLRRDVNSLRELNLDLLWIGTNVTAVLNYITQISVYRIANIQILSGCCPVTSGFRNIDYFISGSQTERALSQEDYSEKLLLLNGPAHCFTFENNIAQFKFQSQSFRYENNISQNSILFVSGANFFKLVPELLELWMKILVGCADSFLLLYPFNPNWTSNYPICHFNFYLKELMYKYSINAKRIIIAPAFEKKDDILNTLCECDVYLDSFPYSGMTSIIDPMVANLPIVALQGIHQRERMSSSALISLGLEDWITENESAYYHRALHLATNKISRTMMKSDLRSKFAKQVPFLNSKNYGLQIQNIFNQLELNR